MFAEARSQNKILHARQSPQQTVIERGHIPIAVLYQIPMQGHCHELKQQLRTRNMLTRIDTGIKVENTTREKLLYLDTNIRIDNIARGACGARHYGNSLGAAGARAPGALRGEENGRKGV